jgi:DNA-directed RNA polymerase beta subunit
MSGITGELKKNKVFMGPVQYLALKHLSYAKLQGVGISTKHAMVSRSPTGGKKNGAAQRFGEMECGAVISFGAAHLFTERLCFSSDAYDMIICKSCSNRATYKRSIENFQCDLCGGHDLGRILIPYSAKLIIDILYAMGINMNFGIRGLLDSPLNESDIKLLDENDLEYDFYDMEDDDDY